MSRAAWAGLRHTHLSWRRTCFLAEGLGLSCLSMSSAAARAARLPLGTLEHTKQAWTMLQQPRSPPPEAQQGHRGDPQLLGDHGAIRGKAAGKEKSDLRDATRLGGAPDRWPAKQGMGFKSSVVLEAGPPLSRQRESSQHIHPRGCLQHCSPHRHHG